MSYEQFRDAFASAMDPRLYPIEYLDWLVKTGRARFWSAGHSAILVESKPFPTGAQAVSGLVAAGDKDEIAGLLIPQAEDWGRANGHAFGLIESRPGWERALRSSGYEPFQVSLLKEL